MKFPDAADDVEAGDVRLRDEGLSQHVRGVCVARGAIGELVPVNADMRRHSLERDVAAVCY